MAVWKNTCRGYHIQIHNVDHHPPHCHVLIEGRDKKVVALEARMSAKHRMTPSLSVDLSGIGSSSVREALQKAILEMQDVLPARVAFRGTFGSGKSHVLAHHALVVADLREVASAFSRTRPHLWTAAFRTHRPFMLACVRTQRDRECADLVDDIMRLSESRFAVCELKATGREWYAFTECLGKAFAALDPEAIIDVRFSPADQSLSVEFSDGLKGTLPIEDLVPAGVSLRPETAVVGSDFNAIEVLDGTDAVFHIDGASIRSLLDPAFRGSSIEVEVDRSLASLGDRLRHARLAQGITQKELANLSGLEQSLISKLERGRHQPRYDTLERYAKGIGWSVSELLMHSPAA
jgi:DNA-binding XRE family transcriptional regulator